MDCLRIQTWARLGLNTGGVTIESNFIKTHGKINDKIRETGSGRTLVLIFDNSGMVKENSS